MEHSGFPIERPASRRDSSDRLIPLINIVFLLLAFFMIAGTIRAADTLNVDHPAVASAGSLERHAAVLYVDANGGIALGHETMSLETALNTVARQSRENPDLVVHLKADRATTAMVILPVVSRLSQIGISRVQLVAVNRGGRK